MRGNVLTTPGGQFLVEEACSGLSFFLVALLLGVCFSKLNDLKFKSGIYFILFAACLAIVANWLRIIIIVIVGSYTQMQHPIVTDHLTFGWIVYLVTLVPLILIGKYYFLGDDDVATGVNENAPEVTTAPKVSTYALVLSSVLIFPILNLVISGPVEHNYGYELPDSIPKASTQSRIAWYPKFNGADTEYKARYIFQGQEVLLYIANYPAQMQGEELINVNNVLYKKLRWRKTLQQKIATDNAEFSHISLKRREGVYRDIGYWYIVGGKVTASPRVAKAYEILAALQGTRGASVIAMAVDYKEKNDNKPLSLFRNFSEQVQLGL